MALNRQLGRAFDMLQVSRLSNTMIDQILSDTETTLIMASSATTQDMISIVQLYQDMLKEIGHLRTTLNDLQLEYVKKIQENGSRLEKEIISRKQQQQQSALVTWVSNMFQLSSPGSSASAPSSSAPRPTPTISISSLISPSSSSSSPLSPPLSPPRHNKKHHQKHKHYQSLPTIISSSSSTKSSSSSSSLSLQPQQQQQPPPIKPSLSSSSTATSIITTSSSLSSIRTSSSSSSIATTSSSRPGQHHHRRQGSLHVSQNTGTVLSIATNYHQQKQQDDDWVMDRRPNMMLPPDMNFRGSLSTSLLVGR